MTEKKPEEKKVTEIESAEKAYAKACTDYDESRKLLLGKRDPGQIKEIQQELQQKLQAKRIARDKLVALK